MSRNIIGQIKKAYLHRSINTLHFLTQNILAFLTIKHLQAESRKLVIIRIKQYKYVIIRNSDNKVYFGCKILSTLASKTWELIPNSR